MFRVLQTGAIGCEGTENSDERWRLKLFLRVVCAVTMPSLSMFRAPTTVERVAAAAHL